MLSTLKNIATGSLVGVLVGLVMFKVLDKTPKVEDVPTPTVKEFSKSDVAPSLDSITVKRIEVDPTQVIVFNTQVSYEAVNLTIARLEELTALGFKQAYIILDSPGGSVIDGANLISYMKSSKMRIDTVCQGICASMAAQIHQAGKTRYMTDKSILMFHPAASRVGGTIEEMLSQLNTIKKYVDRLDAEVAARAGIKYETFKQMLVSELWVESVDAVEMGLADKIAYVFIKADTGSDLVQFDLKKKTKSTKVNNAKGLRDLQ